MVSGRPPGKRSRSYTKHRREVGRTPLCLGERLIEAVDRPENRRADRLGSYRRTAV
jgi:hypothetical protein